MNHSRDLEEKSFMIGYQSPNHKKPNSRVFLQSASTTEMLVGVSVGTASPGTCLVTSTAVENVHTL